MSGQNVIAVCTSKSKGMQKQQVGQIELRADHGIIGDVHAEGGHRQVSLLAAESIEKMRAKGLTLENGAFAENIVTSGIDLISLPIGSRLQIADSILEVTQIGKTCHQRCAIYHQAGDCVMPKEGIFTRVIQAGVIKAGDAISIISQ